MSLVKGISLHDWCHEGVMHSNALVTRSVTRSVTAAGSNWEREGLRTWLGASRSHVNRVSCVSQTFHDTSAENYRCSMTTLNGSGFEILDSDS